MGFDYSKVVGLHDTHICSIEAGILPAVATNTRIASLAQLRQLTGRSCANRLGAVAPTGSDAENGGLSFRGIAREVPCFFVSCRIRLPVPFSR